MLTETLKAWFHIQLGYVLLGKLHFYHSKMNKTTNCTKRCGDQLRCRRCTVDCTCVDFSAGVLDERISFRKWRQTSSKEMLRPLCEWMLKCYKAYRAVGK